MATYIANSRVTVGGVAYRPGEKVETAKNEETERLAKAGYLIPQPEPEAPEKPKKTVKKA